MACTDRSVNEQNRELLKLWGFHTDASDAVVAGIARGLKSAFPYNRPVLSHPALTFEPLYFFFYGSLQARKTLVRVCGLEDENPTLIPASIKGWKMMMWGAYPALVPQEGNEVKGMCWKCEDPEHINNLKWYETEAYRMERCKITTNEGEVIENGRIFVASGTKELSEGAFDLEAYIDHYGNI
ncbi:hypothetical protein F5Y11DRAFT_345828 [Daldinia sp. FL1419]|nr:hypothetical protein F5Y11DRAFT_345828 [Daldinia sp. FL1419]